MNLPNLLRNVVLAPYTTYQIGGPADLFLEVNTINELVEAVKYAREQKLPYFLLGTGANILISDKGFRGLVILNRATKFEFLNPRSDLKSPQRSVLLRAESGAVVADIIEACKEKNLSGFEHFSGIPSSIGGALWQNLHFLNPERTDTFFIESILVEATILDEENNIKKVEKDFFEFGYDDSILHHQEIIVLDATFQLSEKPKEKIQKQIDANLLWRTQKQPQLWEYPSCGSVFKKIEGAGAGRLIEQAGLKGSQIGGAKISEKHANYIMNTGNAKAADVLNLIDLVKKEVKEKLGYQMETEISLIGEK